MTARPRRTLLLAAAAAAFAAAAAAFAACGGSDDTPTPSAVRLDSAGAEPRAPLRLRLRPGTAIYDVRQIEGPTEHSRLGTRTPLKPTGIRWDLHTSIAAVDAHGGGTVSIRISNMRALDDSQPLAAAEETAQLRLVIDGVLDDRGRLRVLSTTRSGEPEAPEALGALRGWGDRFAVIAARCAVELPDSPVGVGARWSIPIAAANTTLFPGTAETELRLVARESDGIALRAIVRGSAGEHERKRPFTETTTHVYSIEVEGDGSLRVPDGRFVAEGAVVVRETTTTAAGPTAGARNASTHTSTMDVRRRP